MSKRKHVVYTKKQSEDEATMISVSPERLNRSGVTVGRLVILALRQPAL